MEDIITIVMTKKTEEDICLDATEARAISTSKISKVCREFMKKANAMIEAAANTGDNYVHVVTVGYKEPAINFCIEWLKELGYKITYYPGSRIIIKW